jgi:small RNA 2'-O-methyltransferase
MTAPHFSISLARNCRHWSGLPATMSQPWASMRFFTSGSLSTLVSAARILDLGCGDGDLVVRLAHDPAIKHIVAMDQCASSLAALARRLAQIERTATAAFAKVQIVHGSMLDAPRSYAGFDCALLIETTEHLDLDRLSALESAVFAGARPAAVIVTTPNAEFNSLLGVTAGRFRHPDHRFEWTRDGFRRWTSGLAARTGYAVACHDIAGNHPQLGGASQMAVFKLQGGR